MSIHSSLVGQRQAPVEVTYDERWVMAFAAATMTDPIGRCFDTAHTDGLIVHPLFPVCVEWAARPATPPAGITMAELRRGVHHTHRVSLHDRLRPGRAVVETVITAVERHRAGARIETMYSATDPTGRPLWTTHEGVLLLGVDIVGPDKRLTSAPESFHLDHGEQATIDVPHGLSHIYTECSRIWNPIHTDRRYSLEAGLGEPMMHGTATLALAVSHLARDRLDQVVAMSCRFSSAVRPPASVTLISTKSSDSTICFDVRLPNGDLAVRDGQLQFRGASVDIGSTPKDAATAQCGCNSPLSS